MKLITSIMTAAVVATWTSAGHAQDKSVTVGPSASTKNIRVALLSGTNEAPPVDTPATGTAVVKVVRSRGEIQFALITDGIESGIFQAVVHEGAPGTNGPFFFNLAIGPFTGVKSGTLTSQDFLVQLPPGATPMTVSTFDQALDAILNGNTYVDIHTNAFVQGEIRGQLLPITQQMTVPCIPEDHDGDVLQCS